MSQEVPLLVSSPTNILTIQDVVLDSPVWRANVLHLEDQIDQFEKWIDGFIRALKNYIEALIKHNALATTLCKRAFLHGLDGTLIDSKIAGNVVNKFATTLQSTVAHRMKTASDLEDLLLNPLQQMIKHDLKSFKDSRKGFDKMLDKYETQLYRYNVLSKQKEASALREDAFQMFELRKQYVRTSGDYFSKLVTFKANLENLLVGCFSGALGAHTDEIDESVYACETVKANLPGWRQWLDESKLTCDYQAQRMNQRCTELQDIYIEQMRPQRSLKRYSAQISDKITAIPSSSLHPESDEEPQVNKTLSMDISTADPKKTVNKQGYLNSRIVITGKSARPPWSRKWFFLQGGWFGTCTVTTLNKEKGCIVLGDRVAIKECVFRVNTDIDRRFCFEVVHPKCSFYLQAENEDEMQRWLWAIEYNNTEHESLNNVAGRKSPKALLSPLMVSNDSSVVMSTSPLLGPDKEQTITPIASTTSSLTALMIREGENTTTDMHQPINTQQDSNTISHQLSSWGMPWLSTGINVLSNPSEEDLLSSPNLRSSNSSTITNSIQQLVVWPTKLEMDVPTPKISHYSVDLVTSQRELRSLFANVPEDEVVIESFLASLYRKPCDKNPDKNESYGYSGMVYVTQKSLWFYSCTMMTCVNMIVLPLDEIKSVRLDSTDFSSSMLMIIEVKTATPFSFGLWLESPDQICDRLKSILENYKTMDIQTLYDTIRNITTNKKTKTPTSHVTTSSALYASVTPLTVQAQQQPMQQQQQPQQQQQQQQQNISSTLSSADTAEDVDSLPVTKEEETTTPPPIQRASPAQGALAAVYNASKKKTNLSVLKQPENSQSSSPVPPPQSTAEEWPSHIPKPKEKVQCECTDHLDKVEADIILPIGAKHIFDLMYGTEVWEKLNRSKNYTEPTFTSWSQNEETLERTVNYVMPVTAPMVKAKETDVIETQQVLYQKEYICYVMMVTTKTPNLPYADAFVPCVKYCITYVSASSCRLVCSIGVKWLKNIFVKGMVNKAATKGMAETVEKMVPILQQEVSKGTSVTNNNNSSQDTVKAKNAELPPIPKDEPEKKTSTFNKSAILFGLAYVMFMIYQLHLSRRYESLLHQTENNGTSMVWRGVYLRDLQDKVTEKDMVLSHVNPNVYELFQEARSNGTAQQWKYPWFSKLHRDMADELGYSRERLGAIRYELLSTFRILNRVEYQLLEIEYWNWLSDQKLMCSNQGESSVCKEIAKERDA